MENRIERFIGETENSSFSVEARYALADWDKIPLNPTFFFEYKFGIGDILHDEGPQAPAGPGEAEAFLTEHNPSPDAVEARLMLADNLGAVGGAGDGGRAEGGGGA